MRQGADASIGTPCLTAIPTPLSASRNRGLAAGKIPDIPRARMQSRFIGTPPLVWLAVPIPIRRAPMDHRPPDQTSAGPGAPEPETALIFDDTRQSLSETLLHVIDAIDGETVTLRWLLEEIGEQGLLILCALLTIPFLLPVSIPGVSTVFGAAIIMISIGITINRIPWLPAALLDRTFDAGKLVPVLRKGAQTIRRLDQVIHPRLKMLSSGAMMNRLNGLGMVFGGVLLALPLGLVPFSNTLPALAILFLAAGISQCDGLFVLLGYLLLIATVLYFAVLALLAFAAGQGLSGFLLS